MLRKKYQRQQQILALCQEDAVLSLEEIRQAAGVSIATVRRDLLEMEGRGEVLHTVRGVRLPGREIFSAESAILLRQKKQTEEKKAIARKAVEFVEEGDTLFISGGSSSYFLSKELQRRSIQGLTIISNSLPVITDFYSFKDIRTICLGGELNREEGTLLGPIALMAVKELRVAKAFMGVQGVHPEQGLTHYSSLENQFDRGISQVAQQVLLLADHTKFNRVYSHYWGAPESFQGIITHGKTDTLLLKKLEERGLPCFTAEA